MFETGKIVSDKSNFFKLPTITKRSANELQRRETENKTYKKNSRQQKTFHSRYSAKNNAFPRGENYLLKVIKQNNTGTTYFRQRSAFFHIRTRLKKHKHVLRKWVCQTTRSLLHRLAKFAGEKQKQKTYRQQPWHLSNYGIAIKAREGMGKGENSGGRSAGNGGCAAVRLQLSSETHLVVYDVFCRTHSRFRRHFFTKKLR